MQLTARLVLAVIVLLFALYGFNEIGKMINGSFNRTAEEIRRVR